MTAYLETLWAAALDSTGGAATLPVVAFLLAALGLILYGLIDGDGGRYEHPKPADWAPRRIGDE